MNLDEATIRRIQDRFAAAPGETLGLSVSGGGDSLALALLASEWAAASGRKLAAVTVDHGLRDGSADEAKAVAAFCRSRGIAHQTQTWDGSAGGNLQDAARRARQRLIAEWAAGMGITAVATGHTLDDQAETVLMRLARGSGVDGLSGIAPVRRLAGVEWHRPLLDVGRRALRDFLKDRGVQWAEDPSNDDERFDRVRARRLLVELGPLGITAQGLADTATRMAKARDALERQTQDLARRCVHVDRGDAVLDWTVLSDAPREVADRLFAHALMWVSCAEYRPRADALARARAEMCAGRTTVLHGCHLSAEGRARRITREAAAVAEFRAPVGQIWDGRWRVIGPDNKGLEVRALGEAGIDNLTDWRASGLPRPSLLSSPAVWEGTRLVAAPLAGVGKEWKATLVDGPSSLIEAIIAH